MITSPVDTIVEEQNRQRQGRELILASREFAVEDRRKSWWHTIFSLLLMLTSFSLTYYNIHWAAKAVFSLFTGLLIVKFFVIYHDYQHKAILKDSQVGKMVMTLFGILVLVPSTIWTRTHNHHHDNNSKLSNSGIGSYPLLSKEDFNSLSRKERFVYLASRHPLTILFGYVTLFILDFNVKSMLLSPKKHWDSIIALLIHFGIGTGIYYFGGVSTLFLSWIIPFVVAHALGAYLFYVQHNFPSASFRETKEWEYTGAALDSTSFLKMSPLMNWLTGDIGYHHVHHVNHHIPFYRLREAMSKMPELQNPKTTTLNPKDVFACLRLKVWDPEKGEMTGL